MKRNAPAPKTKFQQDRHDAFDEIRAAFLKKMDQLAVLGTMVGETSKMTLPEYHKVRETFTWPGIVLTVASDLQADKSLRDVFSRVSARYDSKARPKKPAVAGDLDPAASTDGRTSAFANVLKALSIAERDFDENYRALSRTDIEYWQKKHPLAAEHLQLAYKENQRHFMKETLSEMRQALLDLQNHPSPASPAKPATPPKP